jgi:cysteine desulfurase family protein (TIGR01976 family)
MALSFDSLVPELRAQFPALARHHAGRPVVYLDGPAGTQVPLRVADAVRDYLLHHNANCHGEFPASTETDHLLAEAHRAAADLVGTADPDEISFGNNMTSLAFHLAAATSRTWSEGDEVIVTRLDHDANVRPWVRAAEHVGATVRWVDVNPLDGTLRLEDFHAALGPRTRWVAVTCASNSIGTRTPIQEIVDAAHRVGSLVMLDAVHYAPHGLIDVQTWNADFLACSAYKFFGPHVGILWGRRELREQLDVDKVRPAPEQLPGRWMTGTQNHEGICGVTAAIDYLADIGRRLAGDARLARRAALAQAYAATTQYEGALIARLLAGLQQLPEIRVWGQADPARGESRVSTLSLTHHRIPAQVLAQRLAAEGIWCWHGNYYAWELSHRLGREPDGMLRLGLVHYNTTDEVDRTLAALRVIAT